MWNKKREKLGKHGKFNNLWLDPYMIENITKELFLGTLVIWMEKSHSFL